MTGCSTIAKNEHFRIFRVIAIAQLKWHLEKGFHKSKISIALFYLNTKGWSCVLAVDQFTIKDTRREGIKVKNF